MYIWEYIWEVMACIHGSNGMYIYGSNGMYIWE